ncbi:MAG TPA: hypothetical protein VMU33_13785 [Burkholderiaceae bacterium]|nr:hypothetical protein [Burkholderiaceae bacterium]
MLPAGDGFALDFDFECFDAVDDFALVDLCFFFFLLLPELLLPLDFAFGFVAVSAGLAEVPVVVGAAAGGASPTRPVADGALVGEPPAAPAAEPGTVAGGAPTGAAGAMFPVIGFGGAAVGCEGVAVVCASATLVNKADTTKPNDFCISHPFPVRPRPC